MNLEESRINIFFLYLTIFIFLTNIFLGYGIQITTIYIFPLNEILLLILLISINYFSLFKKMSFSNILTPYLIWFIYGICFISFDAINKGIWALRDGSYIIDSLFILVGFVFFSSKKNIVFFFKIIKFSFYIGLIYIFFWIFKDFLQNISPTVNQVAGEGGATSLFFNFTSLSIVWIWLAFLPIIFDKKFAGFLFYKITPFILLAASIIFLQRRAAYLGLIFVVIFLYFSNKISVKNMIVFTLSLFLFFPITSLLGIELVGYVGRPESIFFIIDHLMTAIPGFTPDDPRLLSAGGTRVQRTLWWAEILNESLSSIKIFLFGKGFGIELVDFSLAYAVKIREPHNGFLSIFARSGIIGLSLFIWLHVVLVKNWLSAYKLAVSNNYVSEKNYLLYLGTYIILIFSAAIADSMFQYPYYAILYYFFWGIILRIGYNLKQLKT